MVKNCPDCGRIFQSSPLQTVCPECWQKNEEDFRKIKEYLYYNPNQNILQVSEATEISIDKIKHYLREDRLIAIDNQSASLLDCKRCGIAIATGTYCDSCKKEAEAELRKVSAVNSFGRTMDSSRMHTRSFSGRR